MIHGATLIGVFLLRYDFAWFLHHPQCHCSAGLCMAAGYEEDSPRTLSRRELMASLKLFSFSSDLALAMKILGPPVS